jgi:hypothetical protein
MSCTVPPPAPATNAIDVAADLVRAFLRGVLTGDLELLTSVCVPHPELHLLAAERTARPPVAALLAQLPRLPILCTSLPGRRLHARTIIAGIDQEFIVQATPSGPRVDASWVLAELRGDARPPAARPVRPTLPRQVTTAVVVAPQRREALAN